MIGYVAYAAGSPCPTFVLDGRLLPAEHEGLISYLTEARRYLATAGGAHLLKIALIRPSSHPMFDLDYRFVQALPAGPGQFDWRGSCGHSILAAVVAAGRMGILPPPTVGRRTRVQVLNNGDGVVCEVDRVDRGDVEFTAHFVQPVPVPVSRLLPTGAPLTRISAGGVPREVSLVSSGNPYVFVDARCLGVPDRAALFAGGADLFDELTRIRVAAARVLGLPVDGAFPKVAAVVPDGGLIAVRAVSVPSWHPTIALTGAVCLASATRIPDTVPWGVAREAGCPTGLIDIRTPGGATTVTAAVLPGPVPPGQVSGEPELAWSTVGRKVVTFHGSFLLEPLAHLQFEEIAQCMALSSHPASAAAPPPGLAA